MRPAAEVTRVLRRVCNALLGWGLGLSLALSCSSELPEGPPQRGPEGTTATPAAPDDAAERARRAADNAWQQIRELYEHAREAGEDVPDDLTEWVSADIQRIGDWEYRVERLPAVVPAVMVATLNEWGRDRWEVYWLERDSSGYRVFLKRTARSYLGHVPIDDLLRWVPAGNSQ